MDINSNNPLIDQLPSQNEVYQNHNNNLNYNNEQTPSNYTPPSIYDNHNNIDQEMNKDNIDNNEGRLSSLDAPPAYDIYQQTGTKDPLIQNNNNYPSQTDKNENDSNTYPKLIDHPLNLPPLQSKEEEQMPDDTNLEVKKTPVYQLQVQRQQINNDRNNNRNNNSNDRSSCDECCDRCCSNINLSGIGPAIGRALQNIKFG